MLSRWVRQWSSRFLSPLINSLARLGITPDGLTYASVLSSWVAGVFLAFGWFIWAAGSILLGGVFDSLDGELARFLGKAGPRGAFLDSVADHYGDFGVYLGLCWYFLALNRKMEILLILAALFGSLIGSHIRSRAGMVGIDTRWTGIFTRAERTLVLAIGLLVNQMPVALGVLAIFNNASALQRLAAVMRSGQMETLSKEKPQTGG